MHPEPTLLTPAPGLPSAARNISLKGRAWALIFFSISSSPGVMNFLNRARNQTAPPEGTVKEQSRQTQSSHRMSRTELFQEPSTRRGKAAMPARWEVERERSAHRGSRWERRRLGETGLKPSDPGRAVAVPARDNAVRRAAGALFKGGGFRVPAPAALPPHSGGGPATPWRSWKIHSGA